MRHVAAGLLFLIGALGASPSLAQPAFSKAFQPSTIAVGSASTLRFAISNGSGTLATNLAFVDNLPAGMTVAASGLVSNSCGGLVAAAAGATSISLSDGQLAAGASCAIEVDVTGTVVASLINTSGDLTSSQGNSGPASATLTISDARLGFSKSFAPAVVAVGDPSRLTFTFDNSTNAGFSFNGSLSDNLPPGLVVADPPRVLHDCLALSPTANANSTSITAFGLAVAANSSCTLGVDVRAQAPGLLVNRTADLSDSRGTAGKAVAVIEATLTRLSLTKEFVDDPLAPGAQGSVRYSIRNANRDSAATAITFSDDFDAVLSGLQAATPLPSNPCGPGSSLSGISVLTLTGGQLGSGASCEFSVPIQVPASATSNTYSSTTSVISASVGGAGQTGNAATDTLSVQPVPRLSITSLTSPLTAGDMFTLQFELTNTSATDTASGIGFSLPYGPLSAATVSALPPAGSCGAGSSVGVNGADSLIVLVNGNLAPSASCVFTVDLLLPAGAPSNSYASTSSSVSATVAGNAVSGPGGSVAIDVVSAPSLTHEFIGPVAAGGSATLRYRLSTSENQPATTTGISFSHDLDAVLTGLVATGTPVLGSCGAGSSLTGSAALSFTGGSLAAADSCIIDVPVQVPAGVNGGNYPSVTSQVSAQVSGQPVTSAASSNALYITSLRITHSFIDTPVLPGATATLRFQLDNLGASAISGIAFTEAFSSSLPSLAMQAPLPTTPCGAGSSVAGTTTLSFSGGDLPAGGSCSFDITLQVPGAAPPGSYGLATSSVSATENATSISAQPATATLEIAQLSLLHSFTDDPVAPGGSVTVQYTISNPAASGADATGIGFSHDLDAVVAGLVLAVPPGAAPCGAGSDVTYTSVLSLTDGTLAPGASCTFSVTLSVPAGIGGNFTSATSTLAVSGQSPSPASFDLLQVDPVGLSIQMLSASVAGGTPQLQINLANLSSDPRSALGLSLDLGGALAGLSASGLPLADVCGSGSTLSGGGLLILSEASLAPAASCTFNVQLAVPAMAAAGVYPLTTSEVTGSGLRVAGPASTSLEVVRAGFSKAFAPASVVVGATSTLTFSIDNSAASVGLTGLGFTDTLPAGMQIASPANASTTCTGGSINAAAGASAVSYSGGSVAAGASCTLSVDVQATAAGALLNTSGALQTSIGNMGTASATLTVSALPTFAKAFTPSSIAVDQTSTLVFTISNAGSSIALSGLDFTDVLPAGLGVATPANASTTCTGGTLTAVAGTSTISYTGGALAAGATCIVNADVRAAGGGSYVNVSGDLTSNVGNLGNATATLTVSDVPLAFSKTITPSALLAGGQVTVDYLIQNNSITVGTSALTFTDDFGALIPGAAAVGLPLADPCGTGSQLSGTGQVTLSGGQVAAGGQCSFSITVQLPPTAVPGTYTSTSSALTGSGGTGTAAGPAASAAINVVALPSFTKQMPSSAQPGTLIELRFTLSQPANAGNVTGLSFTDDLDAFLPGARAEGLPLSNVCGAGSQVSGSAVVSFQGGILAAGQSCSFAVQVRLPANVAGASFTNVTSPLSGSFGAVTLNGGAGSAASSSLSLSTQRAAVIPVGGWPLALLMVMLLGTIGALRLRR